MTTDCLAAAAPLGFIEGAEYLVSFGVMAAFVIALIVAAALKGRFGADGRATRPAGGRRLAPPSRAPRSSDVADLAAELDARLRELRAALAEADAKIAELRSLTEREAAPDQPSPPTPQGKTEAEIVRLAEEGTEPVEIARRLGRSVGEVELVLHLHRARSAAATQAK